MWFTTLSLIPPSITLHKMVIRLIGPYFPVSFFFFNSSYVSVLYGKVPWSSNYSLNMGYIVMNSAYCSLLLYQQHIKTRGQYFAPVRWYRNTFDGSQWRNRLFSSRNQGIPWWPTYNWLAKLLVAQGVSRHAVKSVSAIIRSRPIWLSQCHRF